MLNCRRNWSSSQTRIKNPPDPARWPFGFYNLIHADIDGHLTMSALQWSRACYEMGSGMAFQGGQVIVFTPTSKVVDVATLKGFFAFPIFPPMSAKAINNQ